MASDGGSSRSATSPILIALIVLGGAYYSRADLATLLTTVSPPVPAGKPAKAAPKPPTNTTPETAEKEKGSDDPELAAVEDAAQFFRRHGYHEEVLVATLPDPFEAHDGWVFDTRLDAVMRAIDDANFNLDRSYLPWRFTPDAKPAKPKSADTSRPKFGMVLFRDVDPQRRRLLTLYVVGETATWGIDRAAFNAVMARLPAEADVVRIVGPTYSGSATSLHLAMTDAAETSRSHGAARRFRIRSGSATRYQTQATIEGGRHDPLHATIDYQATVLPDAALARAFWCYLEERGIDPAQVALLRESATAYGRTAALPPPPSETDERRRCCDQLGGCSPQLVIQFPPQISQVRSAYERSNLLKRTDQQQSSAAPKTLELSLDDTADPHDLLAPVTPAMTASTNELVLSNILQTIASEKIMYVGIMATDTRDKLFLARAIHANIPDVRLFTYETDLLYAHPDYQEYLDGMLVMSSYPLFVREQIDAKSRLLNQRVVQFATQGAEGTYNATVSLLDSPEIMLDYGTARVNAGSTTPEAWIMAVSHGALWPIYKRIPTEEDTREYVLRAVNTGRAPRAPNAPSRTATVLFLLVTMFAGLQFWDAWKSPRRIAKSHTIEGTMIAARVGYWRLAYLETIVILHALASVPVVAYALRTKEDRWTDADVLASVGALVAVAISASGVACTFRIVASIVAPDGAERRRTSEALAFAIPGIPLVLFAWYASTVFGLTRRIAWVRLVSPESGLSPLLPMVLAFAVVVLATRCGWRRAVLLATARKVFVLDREAPENKPLLASADAVDAVLHCPVTSTWKGAVGWALPAIASVCAIAPCAVLLDRVHDGALFSFETNAYNRWFLGIMTAAHVLLVFEAARLVAMWSAFRRVLHALAFHPLGEAFGRIPAALQHRIRDVFYCYVVDDDDLTLWSSAFTRASRFGLRARATADAILDFEALCATATIGYDCVQMRNIAVFLMPGALMLFVSLSMYPFQPAGLLTMFCGLTVLGVVGILLYVIIRMDRDVVLSRLAGAQGGVLTLDQSLIGRVLTFGVLPIATVVATQFPSVGRLLTSLLRIVN